jgi:hypothetical protein
MRTSLTKKQIEDLNKKMKYDLQLSFISNTKNVRCYLGSFMTKETEELIFAMTIINIELEKGANYYSLSQLPFFNRKF